MLDLPQIFCPGTLYMFPVNISVIRKSSGALLDGYFPAEKIKGSHDQGNDRHSTVLSVLLGKDTCVINARILPLWHSAYPIIETRSRYESVNQQFQAAN